MQPYVVILSVYLASQFAGISRGDFVLRWAENASNGAASIVGSPDGQFFSGPQATLSRFNTPELYTNLDGLLGVSANLLGRADAIAWEGNANTPALGGGWESARFTISDSTHGVIINHVEGELRPGVLATGSISGVNLGAFYNLPSGTMPQVMSWILLDVPDGFINFNDPFLFVDIQSGNSVGLPGLEGTPDTDAFAIITAVPEPSSFALISTSILLGIAVRRRANVRRMKL